MPLIMKPWGSEDVLEHNEKFVVKRLFMTAGHRCSLQYHQIKRETIYVLSGKLKVVFGASADRLADVILGPHEHLTLPTGMVHRMEAIEDCFYLESSTPELDDVVRLKDDYNRAPSQS